MTFLAQEHTIFEESVRKFAERELLPNLDTWENTRFFPNSVFKLLASQGFLGILIDELWGGVGGDYTLASAWCEEFGRVPAHGLTVAVNMHSLVVSKALEKFGSEESKNQWLRAAVSGDAIGAYAFTEPGAGSDLTLIQTRAVKDGNDFIINGSKTFITNGKRAHFILLLAKTSPDAGYKGFTTFVVDTSLPGFQVTRTLEKLGWHCSDTAELSFTDLRVPGTCVLGTIGQGWVQAMSSLDWERIMLSLNALGGARRCLEETIRYTTDRKLFGRAVNEFEYNRLTLLRLSAQIQSCFALAHSTVQLLQLGKPCRKEASLLKLRACQLAVDVADRCLQLHGGYGYTTEFRPERWLRDLRLNTIGGGTNEVMQKILADECFNKNYAV